uniref:Uncharacterized protein n=1 Tax=Proboscia inermis TaxID=420281 RepID=A0A7S0GDS9_9STRA
MCAASSHANAIGQAFFRSALSSLSVSCFFISFVEAMDSSYFRHFGPSVQFFANRNKQLDNPWNSKYRWDYCFLRVHLHRKCMSCPFASIFHAHLDFSSTIR